MPTPVAGPTRVVRWGHPALRRVARAPDADDPGLPALADAMWRLMTRQGGVGLAAPQVGDGRRLVVIRDPRRPGRDERLVLVDPVPAGPGEGAVVGEEGCLSFPGLFLKVRRARALTVAYRDLAGTERRLDAEGLLARIVAHEIDHLDGVLFVDRIPRWRRELLRRRLARLRER